MQEHQRAVSGSAFLVDGGAISWSSWKQELVTLLTAEAEYVVATHVAKEGIWLHHLITELFTPDIKVTPLYCDNQAANKLVMTNNYHTHTKHIDVCFHFIWQAIKNKIFNIIYCSTNDMVANLLTKALPSWKVKGFVSALGLHCAWGGVMEIDLDLVLWWVTNHLFDYLTDFVKFWLSLDVSNTSGSTLRATTKTSNAMSFHYCTSVSFIIV
jgi:hypothetical protein